MSTPYVGEIRLFSFSRVPTGWFACDGSLQPISGYEVLYTLIGTTYGGDGVSTFGMPDLRGQLPIHQGTGRGLTPRVLGAVGGSESVSLTTANLPSHTHNYLATTAAASANVPSGTVELGALNNDQMYTTDVAGLRTEVMSQAAVTSVGGNLPHENTMPTLTVSFCIAWAGIFPPRS
jgi:microcystin-dependent protein